MPVGLTDAMCVYPSRQKNGDMFELRVRSAMQYSGKGMGMMGSAEKDRCENLVSLLQFRSSDSSGTADSLAFTHMENGEEVSGTVSFRELDQHARSIGGYLQKMIQPGDRVLLVYPPSLEYIAAFFGCVYAGAIAVPALPPANRRTFPRLQSIIKDAQPSIVMTSSKFEERMLELRSDSAIGFRDYSIVTSDDFLQHAQKLSAGWTKPELSPDDTVFLQYTSGSTGVPKGVMVTHRNILANARFLTLTFPVESGETIVSWLPPHHDMGLICKILYPVYNGAHCIQFPPAAFIMRPYRWLKAISDYRARFTAAPNFAYELCIKKITDEQKASLDLSSLRFALNGAEPIRSGTLRRFQAAFSACGWRPETLVPGYGLAESTLLVSANRQCPTDKFPGTINVSKSGLHVNLIESPRSNADSLEIVSTGFFERESHETIIVDPVSHVRQPENRVGEIWVRGPSVAKGYWNRPEESQQIFHANVKGQNLSYLRTGDFGFISNGELYVSGRIKETMIFYGNKIYPQDVELTVEQLDPAFRTNGCAVLAIEEGEAAQLVVIQELESRRTPVYTDLIEKLRVELLEHHGIVDLFAVVLVKAGHVPRTSSGKIQRVRCKELFLTDQFAAIWKWSLSADSNVATLPDAAVRQAGLEQQLREIWVRVLDIQDVALTDNFFSLGGHSLLAAQLVIEIHKVCHVELTLLMLFKNPTIAALAVVIAGIQKNISELIRSPLPIELASNEQARYVPFALNDIQQAYWLGRGDDFSMGGIAAHFYHEVRCMEIDLPRFTAALCQMIKRHDMLRAVIDADGRQRVLETVPEYQVAFSDFSAGSAQAQLDALRKLQSHQMLDLEVWPLFDIRASRIAEQDVRLHFSFDLTIMDATSIELFLRELNACYLNPQCQLPVLSISFRDYLVNERRLLGVAQQARAVKYWADRAEDFPPSPEFPTASYDSLARSEFTRRASQLSMEQWEAFKKNAGFHGITPSAALLTVFAHCLSEWSKSPHFAIHLTHFSRQPFHPQVNDILGDFTKLSLLDVQIEAGRNFSDAGRVIQSRLWNDMDHMAVSGIQVLRELGRAGDSVSMIGMPVVFTSLLPADAQRNFGSALELFGESVMSISQTPQVSLDHQVFEQNGLLRFNWDSIDRLFPDQMLDDMFESYCALLARMALDEEQWNHPVGSLRDAVQTDIQDGLNATERFFPLHCLHTLFDEQASRTPDALAVIAADVRMTYAQLCNRARALAAELLALGVQHNRLVAVMMDKGWEQVVAVLGIQYAGAAYLPLDPHLPTDRLHSILQRTEVTMVLTQSHLVSLIVWPVTVHIKIAVDALSYPPAPVALPMVSVSLDDLAYVIFTSGSTGEPKGVAIDHRGASNTILDVNERFGITASDRILALSSLSFDLSVFDLFGSLAVGATIVIPEHWASREPARWLELINLHHVTVWNSVPALMAMLLEFVDGNEVINNSLRLVMLSGDWIPLNLPDRLWRVLPHAQIISLGGATEASIWSIYYPIEQVSPKWASIPYGRPLANQQFYVFDEFLNQRPVWAVGELYIGGVGLAQGYWQDEETTNASFIRDSRSGERLYKTGDLGRYLPDGDIEFLGRADFQVKLNGHRIELGEIEVTTLLHPSVQAAVIVMTGKAADEKYLLGYVVPVKGHHLDSEQLRNHLSHKLPSYMVPRQFLVMDSLPLTANGKVDRAALPAPHILAASHTAAKPQGIESEMRAIVQEILGIQAIQNDLNIFQLGASSIDAVRIANALQKQLGFRPKIHDFLLNPTIAGLLDLHQRSHPGRNGAGGQSLITVGTASASAIEMVATIEDAELRKQFKNRQHGVRRLDPAFKRVRLESAADLYWQFEKYRSVRSFDPAPLPAYALARLLACLSYVVLNGQPKYMYPSAGGLYPVQAYVYIKPARVQGVSGGVFYYNPALHELVTLLEGASIDADVYDFLINRPVFESAAFSIYLVAEMAAIEPMYGVRSVEFCQIEAGAMAQALTVSAAENGLGLCQVGMMDFERVRSLFALGASHRLVLSLLGGKPSEESHGLTDAYLQHIPVDGNHSEAQFDQGEL